MTSPAVRARETWVGFTVGLVGTAVLPIIVANAIDTMNPPRDGESRRIKALADILAIEEALAIFEEEHGRLPTSEEGLGVLVPTQLHRVPIDPWGYDYRYTERGTTGHVLSYGSDGQPGGEGSAADISRENRYASRERSGILPEAAAITLFFTSVVLLPISAMLRGRESLWRVGVLAGAATLVATLSGALGVTALLEGGIRAWAPLGIGLFFATGALAVLERVRYADEVVCSAIVLGVAAVLVGSAMIAR